MRHLENMMCFMLAALVFLCTGCGSGHIPDNSFASPRAEEFGTQSAGDGAGPAAEGDRADPAEEGDRKTVYLDETGIEDHESKQSHQHISKDENIDPKEAETDMVIQPVFMISELNDTIRTRITGCSYPADDSDIPVKYDDLRYLTVTYVDFEGRDQRGEIICNQAIAQDLIEIFQELYENRYPIEKIRLVDEYGADDERSMADNNSSAFNYRVIYGTKKVSKHGLGMAIDINPLYNPYITGVTGSEEVQPAGAEPYTDREADFSYKIDHEDLCYRLFTEHGFQWGGDWEHTKDYQHFEKS